MGKLHVFRLTRGMDLLNEIKSFCQHENIMAGTVLSSVGCVYRARIRDASGVDINEINDNMEIISLDGTVSKNRCHLHIAFSKNDLSVIGGHLCEGCLINTTCEIVIMEFDGYEFSKEFDGNTGYDELVVYYHK